MTTRLSYAAAIGVVLGVLALARSAPGGAKGKSLPAPDFHLTDLAGRRLSLSSYRGKVVLVDFWATWCAPCREEVPTLIRLQKRYGPKGLEVVGLSLDEDRGKVVRFCRAARVDYPVALADLATVRAFGGILGLPVLFLVRRDGTVAVRHDGATTRKVLEREIGKLAPVHDTPRGADAKGRQPCER